MKKQKYEDLEVSLSIFDSVSNWVNFNCILNCFSIFFYRMHTSLSTRHHIVIHVCYNVVKFFFYFAAVKYTFKIKGQIKMWIFNTLNLIIASAILDSNW